MRDGWLRAVAATTGLALVACSAGGVSGPPPPFRVGLPSAPAGLDPHEGSTAATLAVLWNVYDGLVAIDSDMRVAPALAESWESPTPRSWVFRLRAARFHDGRPVTAADVVFSLERARDDPRRPTRYYLGEVEQVREEDERTVMVVTRGPAPMLLNRLAFVAIVPAGADAAALASTPVGSGPYRVSAWEPGRRLALTRFEGYWGPRPQVAAGEFLLARPAAELTRALLEDRLDLAWMAAPGVDPRVAARSDLDVVRARSIHVRYLGFDLAHARTAFVDAPANPFLDSRVRRAVDVSLDRTRLGAGRSGGIDIPGQLVPRFVFGFDPGLGATAYDPAEAVRLLRAAGFPHGFSVTLHTRPFMAAMAERVAEQLGATGIATRVQVLDEDAYFAAMERHELSLWLDNWGCTTGDAGELFENAMHSADPERGLGEFNETGHRWEALDAAIEATAGIAQPEDRRRALQGVMRQVMSELPWVPVEHVDEVYVLRRPWRFRPHPDLSIRLATVRRSPGG